MADSKPAASFVMAGGGTGGHVIPALAVARELRERGHSVRFIGTQKGIEAKLVPAAGFPIEWIEIGGLNRVGVKRMVETLAELPWSIWQAARALDRAKPVAVFSTGGFVAGPVLLAALWKKIPVVVMEPNAVPGFTHRKLAQYVAQALVSFPETRQWFPGRNTEVTGLPVRGEFFEVSPKPLGETATVLITGGSQGSRTLNVAAEESWPLWKEASEKWASNPGPVKRIRLVLQTGKRGFDELKPKFEKAKEAGAVSGEIHSFLDGMVEAFREADLVVSRAGMGAVSELSAAGKPSILIPLPTAADQHQLRNAEAMERAGAARLVLDGEMNGKRLVEEVSRLLEDPGKLQEMAKAARGFAKPGAAKRAADVLESHIPTPRRAG